MNESPVTREELYMLHTLLSRYELFIAYKTKPSRWEGDDLETIRDVAKMIEAELSQTYEDNEDMGGDDFDNGPDDDTPVIGPVAPGGDSVEVPKGSLQVKVAVTTEPTYV